MNPSPKITPDIDPAKLINVLIDLQIGIRKISLYGFSHKFVPSLVTKLTDQFNVLIETTAPLSFGIGKDEILYQGSPLSSQHPVIGELSRTLHQMNLISVTFKKAVSEDDILLFLEIIVGHRSVHVKQEDRMLSQFHEAVDAISLKPVSFKDAVTLNNNDPGQAATNTTGNVIWKNLVNRLMDDELPEAVRSALDTESETPPDPNQMAAIINSLYSENQKGNNRVEKNYDEAIIDYLNQQAVKGRNSDGMSAQVSQELGVLFSNLRTDVRDQLFRFQTDEHSDHQMSMENLLDVLPAKQLPEVLNHIQLSEQTVSKPMFSLLRKMSKLSNSDKDLKHLLESKLQNHKALFDELLTDRSDREYYPGSHRNLLDSELTDQMAAMENITSTGTNAIVDSETDYHLALIIVELLEGSIYSEEQTEACVHYMKDLLIQGLGEDTFAILFKTIKILLKNTTSNTEPERAFWKRALKTILVPEIVSHLLNEKAGEGSGNQVLQDLMTVTGEGFFPILLQTLEDETNLSMRKQILQFMVQCGPPIIPFVMDQMSSDKWYVVRNMLLILKDLRAKEALPEMLRCMTHESGKVRFMALQALAASGQDSKVLFEALEIALIDEDEKVSKAAVPLIVSSRHPLAADFVMGLFQNSKKGTDQVAHQCDILKAIGNTGSQTWLPRLLPLQKNKLFLLLCWGHQRLLQNEIRNAISKIQKRGEHHAK